MKPNAKKTILVVDDNPEDIAIVDEVLKTEYRVKAATCGEAALKVARGDHPPDLILLAVTMPDMDGFEMCRILKQDSDGAAIPVIFLTSRTKATDEKSGFDPGAVDYIRKPIDPVIVKARIRSHLEQKDRALRSSELRYRRLFETAEEGIMIVDAETGTVIDVNPSLVRMMGLTQESFLGERVLDLGFMKCIAAEKDGLPELRRQRSERRRKLPLETADGRRIHVECAYNYYQVNHREVMQMNIRDITALVEAEEEMTITPVLDDSRCVSNFIAVKNDISERELSRERLESTLRKKSALLREIHHRVNNNMQVMISLLNLSARDIDDAGLFGKLADINRHMHSMALIHEQFHDSEDMARIDFAIFLQQLLERLKAEFPFGSRNAIAVYEQGKALLNIGQAIPAGLIVEELLANALKFAQAGGRKAKAIGVAMTRRKDGRLEVDVRGEGQLLEQGPIQARSLGSMLIQTLSEQLGGSVESVEEVIPARS